MEYKKNKTNFPGVRYREHPTRKKGPHKDRYYFIRYQKDGKRIEEGLGWASNGWTVQTAAEELAKLKKAHRTGEGPQTLNETRQLEGRKRAYIEEKEKQEALEKVTFRDYFNDTYYPTAQNNKKKTSYEKEELLNRIWIDPVIGGKPFKDIAPTDIERIKKKLIDKERSPATIVYALAVIRQVWNMAHRDGLVQKDCPTKAVKKPRKDNRRIRYLTHDEAARLLEKLSRRKDHLYKIVLLSLQTGMRAGEILSLTRGDINLDKGIIIIKDPKNTKTRAAYMTSDIKRLFKEMKIEDLEGKTLVFADKLDGGRIKDVSHAFRKAIKSLDFNKGVTDRRQRVVFHTLRHTFASWLVQDGTDLYTVKELMGHSTLAMTERYSHLGPSALQEAIMRFDENLSLKKTKGSVIKFEKGR